MLLGLFQIKMTIFSYKKPQSQVSSAKLTTESIEHHLGCIIFELFYRSVIEFLFKNSLSFRRTQQTLWRAVQMLNPKTVLPNDT